MQSISSLDFFLFNVLHSLSGKSLVGDWLIVSFAEVLPYVIGAWFIVTIARAELSKDRKHFYGYAIAIISAFAARFVVADGIRYLYHRPRPFLAHHFAPLFTVPSYSFPSGHSIFFFAFSMGMFFVDRKQGKILLLLSTLIALSRVMAGVHYPSDIVAGAILGIGSAYVIRYIFTVSKKKSVSKRKL